MIYIPNWCTNIVTFKIKDFKYKKNFLKLLNDLDYDGKTVNMDFNKFIPYPKKYRDADKIHSQGLTKTDGYNNGGYEWCCKNWGTKWNAHGTEEINEDLSMLGKLTISFETAWAPPEPIFRFMAKKYKGIKIQLKFWVEGFEDVSETVFYYNEAAK